MFTTNTNTTPVLDLGLNVPSPLCQALVGILVSHFCVDRFAVPCSATVLVDDIRTTAAVQQRGRRLLLLHLEFKDVFSWSTFRLLRSQPSPTALARFCIATCPWVHVLFARVPGSCRHGKKGGRAGSVGRRYRDRRGVLHPASFWQNPFRIRRHCSSSGPIFRHYRTFRNAFMPCLACD